MSSVAAPNRVSDMWNSVDMNHQSAVPIKNYGLRQNTVSSETFGYENRFNYSHMPTSAAYAARMCTERQDLGNTMIKSEPVSWQNYSNDNSAFAQQSNPEMVNRWRDINPYYRYAYNNNCNYGYEQRISNHFPTATNANYLDNIIDDGRSINSPGQCSIPETSYGSPSSCTSSGKPASPTHDDSPNLRALLTKPKSRKSPPYYVKDKSAKHSANHKPKVPGWDKSEPDLHFNLPQFHGGLEANTQSQALALEDSIGKLGGAIANKNKGAASSLEAEPASCPDVTRVQAGGDKTDYTDSKMAADEESNGVYPWMKSVSG